MPERNIVISGLTAAGKTTHALLLAQELGYRYISATAIIADLAGVSRDEVGPGFWQKYGDKIRKLRDTANQDAASEIVRQLAQGCVRLPRSAPWSRRTDWGHPRGCRPQLTRCADQARTRLRRGPVRSGSAPDPCAAVSHPVR